MRYSTLFALLALASAVSHASVVSGSLGKGKPLSLGNTPLADKRALWTTYTSEAESENYWNSFTPTAHDEGLYLVEAGKTILHRVNLRNIDTIVSKDTVNTQDARDREAAGLVGETTKIQSQEEVNVHQQPTSTEGEEHVSVNEGEEGPEDYDDIQSVVTKGKKTLSTTGVEPKITSEQKSAYVKDISQKKIKKTIVHAVNLKKIENIKEREVNIEDHEEDFIGPASLVKKTQIHHVALAREEAITEENLDVQDAEEFQNENEMARSD